VTIENAEPKDAQKAETAAPPKPVTAKTAFWEMYKPAHAWAADILPLKIEAKPLKEMKFEEGKAGLWEASFGSPSKKQFTKFTYSVMAQAPDIRKGVTATEALPWAGTTRDALPFQSAEFTTDSDVAFKAAMAKAADWRKSHADVPLNEMSMGAAARFNGPVWYFLWGDKKNGFFQLISASTGLPLK
jgi:hypothetical protein